MLTERLLPTVFTWRETDCCSDKVIDWTASLGALRVGPSPAGDLFTFDGGLTVTASATPSSLHVTNPSAPLVRLWFLVEQTENDGLFSWPSSIPCDQNLVVDGLPYCGIAYRAELSQDGSAAFGGSNSWQPKLEPNDPDLGGDPAGYSVAIELDSTYVGLEITYVDFTINAPYLGAQVDLPRTCGPIHLLVSAPTGNLVAPTCG